MKHINRLVDLVFTILDISLRDNIEGLSHENFFNRAHFNLDYGINRKFYQHNNHVQTTVMTLLYTVTINLLAKLHV